MPTADAKRIKDKVMELMDEVQVDETDSNGWELIGLTAPRHQTDMQILLEKETKGQGRCTAILDSSGPGISNI